MSTSNHHSTPDAVKNSTSNMPSTCSNNNNADQPKTKRQKIEVKKIKSNGRNAKTISTATESVGISTGASTSNIKSPTRKTPPPPDIIDTGEIPTEIDKRSEGSANQLCSSLSSSAQSISSSSGSPTNSPSSTPSSSRATSLSQLLNVQNCIANNLPSKTQAPSNDTTQTSDTITKIRSTDNSLPTSSKDEVDKIAILPDLLPQVPLSTAAKAAKTKTSKPQQTAHNSADEAIVAAAVQDMRQFELSLTRQCLCGVSEDSLQKPFQSHYSLDANGQKRIANLSEWPTNKLLQFLSNLQLLFDIYLKQNSKGFICARIMDVCDALIRNDRNLIDEIIVLASYSNAYVQFLAGRVLASFLVIAKQELNDNWLKKLVDNLFFFERLDRVAVQKIHFSLEIIKRVVEWKDIDLHPLEDEIVDTRDVSGMVTDPTETQHTYMHFQTRQPTLETNYFSVHFESMENSSHNANATANPSLLLNGHEQPMLTDERRHCNVVPLQQQFANFESVSNMPSVPTDYALHGADMPVLHLSAAYGAQAPSTSFNSTHTDHYANHANPHYSLTTANLFNSAPTPLLPTNSCNIVTLTDSESFDTTALKCITIKILENKWPALVQNISTLITNHFNVDNAENCVLNFLQLWENIISVKANLSIVETLPFYAQLDKFESLLLNRNLSCIVYKQMLCLFNEALCYGSTLALQDMVPEETCMLAHQIVRHVKDFRILEYLPRRQPENIVGLIGFKQKPVLYADTQLRIDHNANSNNSATAGASSDESAVIEMDKTILQKMVLLVLKSIAVTVKEIRSDSSDSSIDSTDYDAFQDMVLIERSIRNVLWKLESFIKGALNFHPECHFSKILIHLFEDQDDHLIEAMVCTLDVTSGISFRNNAFPELVAMLNPVYTFLEFLKMISNSNEVFLDLLVSNETCFLLYLLRFLKYIRMNWTMFMQSCHDFGMGTNMLDEAMGVLIRLRLQISRLVSRQLYPYDISPVLRLLESCESLYEGNELS